MDLEGIKKGRIEKLHSEIDYLRVKDRSAGLAHGTVIVGERIIHEYPHIKRIFTLEKGIERNIPGKAYVEEKIDGFNVRICRVDGRIFAFSRGGFLDLFVTEKAREMKLDPFFSKNPDYVLCGEMVGNTPYTSPTDEFDTMLYVFDIDNGAGEYIGCQERYDLLKKFGIRSVPVIGKFDSTEALKKVMIALNKGGKEGVVIKSPDRKKAVKYVTPLSDIEDISKDVGLFFDMPSGFFHQRVLRSAFFISDFSLGRAEYSKKLGEAFYNLINSIKKAKNGLEIDQEFVITFRDPKVWEDIRKHMSREVRIEELSRKTENGRTLLRFRKIYKKTTKLLTSYAGGKGVED